jgi:hypothetical protein
MYTVDVFEIRHPDHVYLTNVKSEIRDAKAQGLEVKPHQDPRVAAGLRRAL